MFNILFMLYVLGSTMCRAMWGHQCSEFPGDREVEDLKAEVPGVQSEHQKYPMDSDSVSSNPQNE